MTSYRFRKVGGYSKSVPDQLLRDLQELDLLVEKLSVAAGIPGPQGPSGPTGADGAAGEAGSDGAQGLAGASGLSAYQIAVVFGFLGTEEEWLESLEATAEINPDDRGFINTDHGLITEPASFTVDYGSIA